MLGSVGGAAAQSWISRTVRADEQGTVQGTLTGIGAVAETLVPVAAGTAFGWLLAYAAPGLVFAGAAASAVLSALLLAATPDVGRDRASTPADMAGTGQVGANGSDVENRP
jgi:DHA1 family tetracycline resistance protein-like MFS transporter